MKITDNMIVTIQFIGATLAVICMIIGGAMYLYEFAWYPIILGRPLAVTASKVFLMSGVWLLVSMQLIRVLMVLGMFLSNKERLLSTVSFMILVILTISIYVSNF